MTTKLLGPAPAADPDAVRLADLPGPAPVTRIISYCNGGMDGSVPGTNTTVNTQAGLRTAIRIPVTSTRWRIKMRNYGMTGVAKTGFTGKGIIVGRAARVTSGAGTTSRTGGFVGNTATTIVSGDFAIPGDGSWYTSPWVTNPANQFEAGVEYLIGIGYQTAASLAVQNTWGECFYWNNFSTALNPATSSGTIHGGIPLDFVVEYECTTTRSAWLWVGDSISEGVTGVRGTSGANIIPQPLWMSYPQMWAARNNALVLNMSLAGIQTHQFLTTVFPQFFSRMDLAAAQLDGAVIATGSNDFFATPYRTDAQFKDDLTALMTQIRSVIGDSAPIYLAAIIPRTDNLSGNTTRHNYRIFTNEWMASLPYGAAGFIDFDFVMRPSLNATALQVDMTTDLIHPSFKGSQLMAATVAGVVGL
ncbi:SGNH/GDSL hydrolase family protein [Nocardia cyriacigeorgica]|uniref:SGNH/GDSL hydrolase family protein n=2 Tax=Nocardia cyriacigeorgica TaxID=135487 RepID=A0A5R8NEG7_9NOCA|nr:SGNH/GDSL hydrolase family protein [Nocardia cyriacigeorgica]